MATLEKRIAALETAGAVGAEPITLVVQFVKPGHLDAEIQEMYTQEGQSWQRVEGETQQELIDRATREVTRSTCGVASLFADPASTQHDSAKA